MYKEVILLSWYLSLLKQINYHIMGVQKILILYAKFFVPCCENIAKTNCVCTHTHTLFKIFFHLILILYQGTPNRKFLIETSNALHMIKTEKVSMSSALCFNLHEPIWIAYRGYLLSYYAITACVHSQWILSLKLCPVHLRQ